MRRIRATAASDRLMAVRSFPILERITPGLHTWRPGGHPYQPDAAVRNPGPIPALARFEVARFGFCPEGGRNKKAQGNALGTGEPMDPCPERAELNMVFHPRRTSRGYIPVPCRALS